MSRGPDFKQGKRLVDPDAVQRSLFRHPECAACGVVADSAHHVVQKGSPHFGDDVEENVVGLCGHGTARCHGAFHGSPYTVAGERRDAEWVGRRIGQTLLDARPECIAYVLVKLGQNPGRAYLERFYYIS
jgi:hypothetical protein